MLKHSMYDNGFVRVAACMPEIELGNSNRNADGIIDMAHAAYQSGSLVLAFPELSITGYSLDDLFRQEFLIHSALKAIQRVARETTELEALVIVGAPVVSNGQLFNTAVVIAKGAVLGVVPKTYLPNYGEFHEVRQFAAARHAMSSNILIGDRPIPFGTRQIFRVASVPGLSVGIDICEDLWAPIPPSSFAALAGATLLVNLSASNASVGKADYRRSLVLGHSAKCIAGVVYVGSGPGESTTDLAWDTHSIIAENGTLLAESERFLTAGDFIVADVDMDRLGAERMRMNSFRDSQSQLDICASDWITNHADVQMPKNVTLSRQFPRYPFVPEEPADREKQLREVFDIQIAGLTRRLESTGLETLVLGVSGGLDSTLALLVAVRVLDRLGRDRKDMIGVSMPGFGTSQRTQVNARALMESMGITSLEIDIRSSCEQMFRDLQHPFSRGQAVFDVIFENVQAGARTSLLFRLANQNKGLVVGSGDLSELALGWCTYGVGDHMSHYGVNSSIPKTLVRHLIESTAYDEATEVRLRETLVSILDTPISPELLPLTGEPDEPQQITEASVGPFALQDFFLYHTIRFGHRKAKLLFLARNAWGSEYDDYELEYWLDIFMERFFQQSQFKRSALPNGPKVGTGGNLSPRGDWRAPSDISSRIWLQE